MRNTSLFFFALFIIVNCCFSQEEQETVPSSVQDSVASSIGKQGVFIQDSLFVQKKVYNPLAPSKAAFFSAILPGLGQIYNKKYWKVPLVYGAIGGSIYAYTWNNDNYKSFRSAFKRRQAGFTDDEYFDINGDNAQELHQI